MSTPTLEADPLPKERDRRLVPPRPVTLPQHPHQGASPESRDYGASGTSEPCPSEPYRVELGLRTIGPGPLATPACRSAPTLGDEGTGESCRLAQQPHRLLPGPHRLGLRADGSADSRSNAPRLAQLQLVPPAR